MYAFKEVVLKNDNAEKTILVIEFADPKYAIVGEFLMADASLLDYSILEKLDNVLTGEVETVATSGNRCSLVISQETTLIEDLLEDMFVDFESYEAVKIPTQELKELILVWREKSTTYHLE